MLVSTATITVTDLSLATAVARVREGAFALDVPAGWEQGRGAFGGVVVGAMARAAIASEPDAQRTLRAVSAEILSPVVAGPADVSVEVLKRGSGVSALDVRIRQDGEVRARGTFTLARTRVTDRDLAPRDPPTMRPFESVTRAPIAPPLGPAFAQHLDLRPTGALPFSGAPEPGAEGWVHAVTASSWGPPEWLALVDAYWPTILAIEPAPRPAVTLTFSAQLIADAPRGPLYYRARALGGRDGFVGELRELFAPDGTLVVVNPQVIAIVK